MVSAKINTLICYLRNVWVNMLVVIYDHDIKMSVYVEIKGVFRTMPNIENLTFCENS